MNPIIVSTENLPPRQQFDAWYSWFSPVFSIHTDGREAAAFAARSTSWPIGPAFLSRVKAPDLKVTRDETMVRRDPSDHWNIAFSLGGVTTHVLAGDDAYAIPPGVPFAVSLGQRTSSTRLADERLQLYFPRDKFSDLNAPLEAMSGQPLNTPRGMLLADLLLLLERRLPEWKEEDLPALTDVLRGMIGACVAPTRQRVADAENVINLTRMDRVRNAIRRQMSSSRLGPETLCRELGMSRTQLYRLLEGEGGVAHYIQRFRLQEVYASLSNPAVTDSISVVAARHGFPDPSSFGRIFRRAFGITPTEVRAAAQAGMPMLIPAKPIVQADLLTLRNCLRSL